MNTKKTLILTLMLALTYALPITASADNGNTTNNSTGTNPEVTIGFGNVTNDTLVFTMDTSVDVYSYQVTMSWEVGAVYCNIEGTGGLSEDHNLFVSVLYAGCLATGYYYGAQGEYHIPTGSNGTLTSIYYQSNSPEICMGNATYTVLDANDELEWRNATVDPNDCLTFTRYETADGTDVWFVLDELDFDGDGVPNADDDCPDVVGTSTQDQEGCPDEDGDGYSNAGDDFPDNSNEWEDSDGDGSGDNSDLFPMDPTESEDSDGDGVGDNADAFPNDPNETSDMDGDGVGDNSDMLPFNAFEIYDSDGDGVGDNGDAFPNDASESEDSDGDGVGDNTDAFPTDALEQYDSDGDGVGDNSDAFMNDASETLDSDADGVGDNSDAFTNDASETLDSDGDGVGDNADAFPNDANESADSDGDGIGNVADQCSDTKDGITVGDNGCALDGDSDGVPDMDDQCPEVDASALDENLDGCLDDDDGDGVFNSLDDCPATESGQSVSEQGCSEAQLNFLNEDSDAGNTNAGENSEAQVDTSSSKERYVMILSLLSFFVLIGILIGTVGFSRKEDVNFSSVFEEGGVDMDELLGLLGRSKMLKVMQTLNLHSEGIRFNELKISVDTSATTLSRRLGELEEFGLVSRTELPTVPMTVIYRLTDAGISLMPRLEGMFEWALNNGQ
jgi:DNA-binding HxlR family transcriptional regulator